LAVNLSADGNVESAVNIDLKCEVAKGSAILWIVEDGEQVKQGDKLVELDSSALEEQVNTQRIAYEKARAVMIQAEKDFAAAKIAVQEYLEGTFVTELLKVESNITIATENLRSAQNTLDHSQRMFRKGYISALDLASQTFSVQRAQLELDSANTAKDVLVKYTKVKMVQELESKRDSAEAQVNSEKASFALEESRLKRLEAQVLKCVITAPADGMAVYANETDHHGRSEQPQIELGAAVRERQTILRLPDLAQMQVKINVHESRVEALGRALRQTKKAGQVLPARVVIQGKPLQGRLVSIANQPAPIDFRMGNIKQYPAIVAIDGSAEDLRPGMTAKCEVVLDTRTDVLMVPVAAIVEQQGEYVCWVATDDGFQRRPLVVGTTGVATTDEPAEVSSSSGSNEMVEVKDGVRQGELVVLNPRAMVPEARMVLEQVGPTRAANERTTARMRAELTAEAEPAATPPPPAEPSGSAKPER
jgi:HlyD family secretion protein